MRVRKCVTCDGVYVHHHKYKPATQTILKASFALCAQKMFWSHPPEYCPSKRLLNFKTRTKRSPSEPPGNRYRTMLLTPISLSSHNKTHQPNYTKNIPSLSQPQYTCAEYTDPFLLLSEPNITFCFSLPELKNEWFRVFSGCAPMFSTMPDTMVKWYTVYTASVYSIHTSLANVLPDHSIPHPADTWTTLELHKVAWWHDTTFCVGSACLLSMVGSQ